MKKILIGLLTVCLVAGAEGQLTPDMKYGMLVHWGLLPFTGDLYQGGRTKDWGFIPAARFAPTGQNAAQWAKLAKDGGMTFAIMVVKHEDGFSLWRSAESDYTIAQSPCKLDLAGNFITACKTEGIVPGFFYSLVDVYNEGQFRANGPVGPPFFNLVKKQIVELLSRYSGARILVLDATGKLSPAQLQELLAAARKANPQCMILGDRKVAGMGNYGYATVVRNWFWQTNAPLAPVQIILDSYYKTQTNQVPFLVNVSPDRSGRIPDDQVAVVKQVRDLTTKGMRTVAPAPAAPAAPVVKPNSATRPK